jgi:hypothetical protein
MQFFSSAARLFASVFAICANFVTRIDPFDGRGRVRSRLARVYHRNVNRLALALALVAIAILPAAAMPIFSAKTGVITGAVAWKTGLAGLLGATQQAPQKMPFRLGTVRRRINIGTFAVNLGGAIPSIVIPQVGMLGRVFVDIEGTYTKANATGTNFYDGYDAIVSRAQITLNNGSANLVDLSGVGINIVNKDLSPVLPIKRGLITTAGAQTFSYKFILPVNANQKRQFEMGLINLQAPEIRANVNLSFNPQATIFATSADVTLFTATANVSYEYYEIPPIAQFDLPPLTLVRTIEEAPVAIAAVGLQLYQIPRLGTMFDYHAVMVLNKVYTTVLTKTTEFAIRYNKSDVQYDVFMGDWETYEAELYGRINNGGTFLFTSAISFNLWAADNRETDGGDFRDAIDTEENTTTETLITVAAGTVLTAGLDNFFHVRRVAQRITQAPAPRAA